MVLKKAKSLIDVVNMFKPEALTGEQSDFYQDTAAIRDGASFEFHYGLYKRIVESTGYERLLVIGHGGSGKSTEMNMLKKKLSDKQFPVIHLKAMSDLDFNNFTYIDIFIRIVEKIANYAYENSLTVHDRLISAFEGALSTKSTKEYWDRETGATVEAGASVSASSPFMKFLSVIAKISASLRFASGFKEEIRREIKPRMDDVIAALNAFIEDINSQASRKVVIIIDELEKCRQESVRKLFVEDVSTFSGIKAHMTVACPIGVYRSADAAVLTGFFPVHKTIPMIKTHDINQRPDTQGVGVIKELVLKRADDAFFEENVLETIIIKAGGSLRDTCYLLSECAFESYMNDKKKVDMVSADRILKEFAVNVFYRARYAYYSRVNEIYRGDHDPKQDEASLELLYSGAAFEYDGGNNWIDLHPLLRQYIQNNPGVLGFDG